MPSTLSDLTLNYLGLIIDSLLLWHAHIDYISSKISKSLNIIAKLHMTSQYLIRIKYALVYPYLTYGCVLLSNNYEAPLSQLVRLQNKVVRIINNVPLCDNIIEKKPFNFIQYPLYLNNIITLLEVHLYNTKIQVLSE